MNFPDIKAFATNWVNGMKLSAGHFQHLEKSVHDTVRDARALGTTAMNGFGLLPHAPFLLRNGEGATSDAVRIKLEACRAVLPGGYRVEVLPGNIERLQLPGAAPCVDFVPRTGVHYSVFLVVGPERKAFGHPEIQPTRHPYLLPDCQLEVLPSDQIPEAGRFPPNRMKIGEWQNGKLKEGYIPAALTILGNPLLEQWHGYLEVRLENIKKVCEQVITEFRAREPARAAFCTPILLLLRSRQGEFRHVIPRQSPLGLVAYYEDLAGLVEALLVTTDKDFVRTTLQNGQVHNLLPAIKKLTGRQRLPHEEMALFLTTIIKFSEALTATLRGLTQVTGAPIHSGDRNIKSG